MTLPTSDVLLVAGGALLAAFLADIVARRAGFPDILLLLGVGVLAGPVLHVGGVSSILSVAPYLGTAALALILFDAGMDLRRHELEGIPTQATLLAAAAVGLSMLLVFPLAYFYLTDHSPLLSLLFAGALSCTSSAVVVPVASRMSLPSRTRSLVHVSSALEDTMAIIIVTSLMFIAVPSTSKVPVEVLVILPLPLGLVGGFLGGLAWIEMTRRFQTLPFFSMATAGFLFAVVGLVQALGGAGVLAALILGIMMGNAQEVRSWLGWTGDVTLLPQVRQFQSEIAFLLRAFFMLVLGMLMVFGSGYEDLLIVGGVISAVLLVARSLAVEGFLRVTGAPRSWNFPLASLGARGLTSAVLVIIPVTAGIVPTAATFLDPTLIVVVATVVVTSVGVFVYEHVPSVHEGRFGERRPTRAPLTDEDRRRLREKDVSGSPSAPSPASPSYPGTPVPSPTPAPPPMPLSPWPPPSEPPSPPSPDQPAGATAPPLPTPKKRSP
jgi:potassium/hydrogen antiporter